jgi:type II secretion system protein H
MRSRNGFTLLEVLIVLIIVGVVGGVVTVNVNRGMQNSNVQRAASVIATDLRQAHSLAARQRRPVEIVVDPTARVLRVRDALTPTTVYAERHFGLTSEQPVQGMTTTESSVRVFPNGLASSPVTVTVSWGPRTRTVLMTRAGMVRVGGT